MEAPAVIHGPARRWALGMLGFPMRFDRSGSSSHIARTALLLSALATFTVAAAHFGYQYLRLAEAYSRLILH